MPAHLRQPQTAPNMALIEYEKKYVVLPFSSLFLCRIRGLDYVHLHHFKSNNK